MRTIAHISDLHFGRVDCATLPALTAAITAARPDVVAISGDLTQRARARVFAAARRFLDTLTARQIAVPGNHDVPLYAVHRRLLQPYAKFNRFIAPAGVADSFFADKELAVLGLNTARRLVFKGGRVSLEQMNDIRRAFADLPELRAEDLRLAWRSLGRITGRVDVEDLLDVIFRDFCLGK